MSLRYIDNILWVGTRQGFGRFDGTSWASYAGDGLPDPEVLAIAPAAGGAAWISTGGGLVRFQPERTRPWVRIDAVNLTAPAGGVIRLKDDALLEIRLSGGDLATRPSDLLFLTEIVGVDRQPQLHRDGQIRLVDQRLAAGEYRLRAQARDTSLNYSAPVEVTVVIPRLVHLPGGRAVPAGMIAGLLALALICGGGLAAAGSLAWRARGKERRRLAAEVVRGQVAIERRFNPYIAGEPVRQPEMFFGRDALLQKILNSLHQNSIMIYGERRIGKTTLLQRLAQALAATDDPEWAFVPVPVDMEGVPQDRFFHTVMEAVWSEAQAFLPEATSAALRFKPDAPADTDPRSADLDRPARPVVTEVAATAGYTDRDLAADLRTIIDHLKPLAAPRSLRLILLIDEMDVIDQYDRLAQLQLRRIFMSPLAANLGAVVAGVQINKAWDRVESPWYNLFNEFSVPFFDDDQAQELLTRPVAGIYEWDAAAVKFVVARAEGRPYRLQQFGLEAVNQMLAAGRRRILMADVQAADALLRPGRGVSVA